MKNLESLLKDFNGNKGATDRAINAASVALGVGFPEDYIGFLRATDGGEGMIGEAYVMLWKVEELKEMNASYQVAEYVPGLLFIGSDGGGEAFAFDMRSMPWSVVQVPFVGMELDAVEVLAPSFEAFLRGL